MAKFEPALANTMRFEGGYANDPKDKGGETYRGISRVSWPGWAGWEILDTIQDKRNGEGFSELESLVPDFYRDRFWFAIQGDSIDSQAVANYLFDFAVNSGVVTAVKELQKAVNSLVDETRIGVKVEVDGLMGNKTIAAVNIRNDDLLLREFRINRLVYLYKLMQPHFARGWIMRAIEA